MPAETCTWCGESVEPGDGYRAYEPAGERSAVFCRLEHVVPWGIRGARWDPGEMAEPEGTDSHTECAHCGKELGEAHVVLVRHRDAHRIPDAFCSADHMVEWAKAGGRWAP